MTVTVAGADGCRAGWVVVLRRLEPPFDERAFLAKSISELLHHPAAPEVKAIDIPIGLPDRITCAGRDCDAAVRLVLGKRASAVFAVPARAAVRETEYRLACATTLATSMPPRQISKQMFHLFPKIREVDDVMTPALQNRVYECHPEAAFWAMNGKVPLPESKKRGGRIHRPGIELRRSLLVSEGFSPTFLDTIPFRPADAGLDDLLDACACAWTAARIYKGEAIRFGPQLLHDAKGLRIEILA